MGRCYRWPRPAPSAFLCTPASRMVIDRTCLPTRPDPMQFRHREVVDPMRERLVGRDPEGGLYLSQDRAHMRHRDNIAPRMGGTQSLSGARDAGGHLMPAFAAGGADIARLFPKSAQQGLIGHGIKSLQFPCAKMDFAQVGIIGKTVSPTRDGISSGTRAAEVRGNHQGIVGQMRCHPRQPLRSAGISDQPTMDLACVGPWRTQKNRLTAAYPLELGAIPR